MPFKKGQSGNPAGKPKGAITHLNRGIKEMIVGALARGGGEDWLLTQMEANPVAFMGLVGKVLPMQVTGEGDGPVVIKIVRFSDGQP